MGAFSNALLDRIAGPGQAPVAQINPLDQQEKQQAIAESSQAQQLNAQKIEQQKMVLDDQKTLRSLQPQFVQKDESGKPTGYDWNGLISAAQGKVMPATLFSLQKQQSDLRQSMATATKDELANQKEVNGELYQRAEGLKGITDPNERQKHYESTLGWAQQHGVDVNQWPAAAPDNDHITALESGFGMHAQALADQKTQAETKAAENKALLDTAQTEAANYKEDPNLGLIDLRTKQPVSPNALAPLGPGEAEVLGKKPGDMVPLKLKNTANEIVNRGIHVTSANGRQLMVDGQGNTIKDLGTAPAVVNFNMQGGNQQYSPDDPDVQKVAKGAMKIGDVMTPRTPLPARRAFLAAVLQANPDFDSRSYDVEKGVMKKFTSGNVADQLMAIGTAREHMKTFSKLAAALDTNDVQALNKIGQAFGVQFGSDKKTNFDLAAQAFGGEVGRAFDGAGVTAGEREKAEKGYKSAMSKGQFKGAIETVDELLAGKQKAAKTSYDQGVQAKPNFGGDTSTADPFAAFGGKKR